MAYYTVQSGAAGFNAGTSDWVTQLDSRNRKVRTVVTTVTTRLLQAFAAGPAGRSHPATDNAAGPPDHLLRRPPIIPAIDVTRSIHPPSSQTTATRLSTSAVKRP